MLPVFMPDILCAVGSLDGVNANSYIDVSDSINQLTPDILVLGEHVAGESVPLAESVTSLVASRVMCTRPQKGCQCQSSDIHSIWEKQIFLKFRLKHFS